MTYAPRRTRSGWEVRDQRGRVAYLPSRPEAPGISRRVASVVANALNADANARPSLELRLSERDHSVSVWDGVVQLASFSYNPHQGHDLAQMRASTFADGYLVARAICLGEQEKTDDRPNQADPERAPGG